MTTKTTPFGASPAKLIRIANGAGGALVLTELGAAIVGLEVPSCGGVPVDVVLGYDSYDDYMADDKYFGAVVGRYANRIARGELPVGGMSFELDRNEGGKHTLHGGSDGWHQRIWNARADDSGNAVTFSLHSPDMDQGFPGAADVEVRYRLTDDNAVHISYRAVSDRETVFNLTNHSYFNLSGAGAGDILEHWLRLGSAQVTEVDADAIPTGKLLDVGGTALDFSQGKKIGRDIGSDEQQVRFVSGFDHNYAIGGATGCVRPPGELAFVAEARSEATGISMEVYSDMPGVQLYTGNYLDGSRPGKGGRVYKRNGGFCLETQFYPDSPHHAHFPSAHYRAGEVFESETVYSFA